MPDEEKNSFPDTSGLYDTDIDTAAGEVQAQIKEAGAYWQRPLLLCMFIIRRIFHIGYHNIHAVLRSFLHNSSIVSRAGS